MNQTRYGYKLPEGNCTQHGEVFFELSVGFRISQCRRLQGLEVSQDLVESLVEDNLAIGVEDSRNWLESGNLSKMEQIKLHISEGRGAICHKLEVVGRCHSLCHPYLDVNGYYVQQHSVHMME